MSDSWFEKGDAGYEKAKKMQEERAALYGPRRFWLEPGKSAKITFLDSEGFYFMEHELKINGRWGNHFTCTRDFRECPLCESGFKSAYGCAYTIIDHSSYTSPKTGQVYAHQKKLLVVRSSVINKLARRRESLKGNLKYSLFLFSRDKKEECRTGEDIEWIKVVSPADLTRLCKPKDSKESNEDFLKPFDYMEIFKPLSVEELRKIAGQPAPVGSENYDPSGADHSPGMDTGMDTMDIPPGAGSFSEENLEDLL
jgi:hypothetical protein